MKSQLLMSFCLGLAGFVAAVPSEAEPATGSAFAALRRAGKRMAAFFRGRGDRVSKGRLHQLSDHMLKDIGLDRAELHFRTSRDAGRRQA